MDDTHGGNKYMCMYMHIWTALIAYKWQGGVKLGKECGAWWRSEGVEMESKVWI